MAVKRPKSAGAFTLIEVIAAILILSIAVLGTSGYRYYAALDARKATMHTTAAGIGLLLCESWRGLSDPNTFAPDTYFGSDLAITPIAYLPGFEYEGFTPLGGYRVVVDGANYYALLSWKDVGVGLMALNVVVAWTHQGQVVTSIADIDKSFELTTYTSY